jgi:hypothetical protein
VDWRAETGFMAEYRTHLSKDGVGPDKKTILGFFLCFVLGLFLVAGLLNYFVTKPLWKPNLGKYSARLAALEEYADEVDVIFVGSSHLLYGVNPVAFDEKLASLGSDLVSYNASEAGAITPIQANTLDAISAAAPAHLETVFFEPMFFFIPVGPPIDQAYENLFSTRTRYLYDFPNTVNAIDKRWSSDRPLSGRLGGVTLITAAGLIHQTNFGVLRDVIFGKNESMTEVGESWAKRGFTGARPNAQNLDFSELPDLEAGKRKISRLEASQAGTFLEKIRSAGANPIFLFPPTRESLGRQVAVRDAVKQNYPDIMVMDYLFDTHPLPLYFDESLWLDSGHLNDKGARVFSHMLANDWLTITDRLDDIN